MQWKGWAAHMLPPMGMNDAAADMLDFSAAAGYGAAMSTDARSMACRYYAGSGRNLGDDMAALAANPQGVVVFLPRLVALMKPVEHARPESWLALGSSPHGADAWYVHLLAGELAWALQLGRSLPAYPWLCFQRGARSTALHRWRWSRVVSVLS